MSKAVILAAGKSSKFFPPLYDKPKGLFTFNGEVLIERQIEQLHDAGIQDITVVIGYQKEDFFYLEQKYNVNLVVSTKYNDESNLSSLALVKDQLRGAYLCCADHWYKSNPFLREEPTHSIRLIKYEEAAKNEFAIDISSEGFLENLRTGEDSGICMAGYAFFTEEFADLFFCLLEKAQGSLGLKSLLWEQFWGLHSKELHLWGEEAPEGFKEFDSLDDFQSDGQSVLDNVSQTALSNICSLLKCKKESIRDIKPLNKGLTNVSFSFLVHGEKYVYRHPGASSSNLVNRETEVLAQNAALDLGIDSSVIAIDVAGWKLSHYVEAIGDFSYDNPDQLSAGINQIKKFHAANIQCDYEINLLFEGDRLMSLACNKKGDLFSIYSDLHDKVERLWHYTEIDGVPKVLCHNDAYAVNWIVGKDSLHLIDWEYAGMNDPVNDIATLVVRDGLPQKKADEIIQLFYGGSCTFKQKRHAYAYFALCGWYWFGWSLFKDTLGEDGFFMLPSYRALCTYSDLALSMYEGDQKDE